MAVQSHDYDAAPVAPWDTRTPYEKWRDGQGIPVHSGFHIPELTALPTAAWDALGAEAAFVDLEGTESTNASYVVRIAAGEATSWRRHLYEEIVYVAQGSGVTHVRRDGGGEDVVCRWQQGSVFAIPLNRQYRHVAAAEGAFLYCVNAAPLVMNLFHDEQFVWNNPFVFGDRFDDEENDDFFSGEGRPWRHPGGFHSLETNFVRDTTSMPLAQLDGRGKGNRSLSFQFGENTLVAHISEFPSASYKKAHRHGPGAHVIFLCDGGYSTAWRESYDDQVRVDWQPNGVFVPPNWWWHQHFNTSSGPGRYVAIRWGSRKHRLDHSYDQNMTDRRDGGNQIEYEDENPDVRRAFDRDCAEHGAGQGG
jgi:quercetin dioxygenase-like cupin family protein/uncharacterized RmlC-like cupin family protein